jgi:ABC-type phosphate/phosphonate transport system substrate-binding protein
MRDTDQDLTSVVVARPGTRLADVRRLGVGAGDSPQATLIPRLSLAEAGLEPELVRHDVLLGKHGDHVGGERDAVRALLRGEVDAAAILDGNLLAFQRDGTLPAGAVEVIHQTAPYDHCNFTVIRAHPGVDRFVELLLAMDYNNPAVRPLMDLEGLTAWRPGRTEGYALLERAVDRFGTLDPWLSRVRR